MNEVGINKAGDRSPFLSGTKRNGENSESTDSQTEGENYFNAIRGLMSPVSPRGYATDEKGIVGTGHIQGTAITDGMTIESEMRKGMSHPPDDVNKCNNKECYIICSTVNANNSVSGYDGGS